MGLRDLVRRWPMERVVTARTVVWSPRTRSTWPGGHRILTPRRCRTIRRKADQLMQRTDVGPNPDDERSLLTISVVTGCGLSQPADKEKVSWS